MRSLSVLALIVVVGPLAACSTAGQPVAAPATATATAPSTEPSPPCTNGFPRQIPVGRMLAGGEEICAIENDEPDVVPRLCLNDNDMQVADQRTLRHLVSEVLSSGEAPTVYSQTVLVFKPGTAATYLSRLRTALTTCPSRTRAGMKITYSGADGPGAGDEAVSMRVEYRYLEPIEVGPQVRNFRVIAVRVGDQVSVIYDRGWEGFPSLDQTIFNAAAEGSRLLERG